MRIASWSCALVVLASLGCGAVAPDDSDGGSANDGGTRDAADGMAEAEAGWTQCSAPNGLAVCDGPNCPSISDTCNCADDALFGKADGGALSYCVNDAYAQYGSPADDCEFGCLDGNYCMALVWHWPDNFVCSPPDMKRLYEQNGAADRIHYADWSTYTGDALPTPATCPTLPGVPLCGGPCAPCGTAQRCTGRSPLHPYSLCVPEVGNLNPGCSTAKPACPAGHSCFTFKVDSASQPLADSHGYCMPTADCQAAASSLPGGGSCQ